MVGGEVGVLKVLRWRGIVGASNLSLPGDPSRLFIPRCVEVSFRRVVGRE